MGEKAFKPKTAKERSPAMELLDLVAEILVEQDAKAPTVYMGEKSNESAENKGSDIQE
jgi:hypothetical protein